MATFTKRIGQRGIRWEVRIRKQKHPTLSKTFSLKSEAQSWANEIELRLQRGEPVSRPELRSLKDVLSRYVRDVTTKKKGAEPETCRIGKILRHEIASLNIAKLSPTHIASYRDQRLKDVSPSSVVMELMLISHALDTAKNEWGVNIPTNVVRNIRKPKVGRGRDRRLALQPQRSGIGG